MEQLSAEQLRARLIYDPDTGEFRWRVKPNKNIAAGAPAGCRREGDYHRICVFGRLRLAHRLAWLYVHGESPAHEIDHINGNRADNRIANLRDVPHRVNTQNQRKAAANNKSSCLLGVTSSGSRHRAFIWAGRQIYLGTFHSAEEAHAAYLAAKRQFHEGCTL